MSVNGVGTTIPAQGLVPPPQRRVRVGLLWHSLDSANLGVVALTIGQMQLVRQAAMGAGCTVEFGVLGGTRDGVSATAGADVVDVCRVTRNRLLGIDRQLKAVLSRCDIVLDIGEGDSFADIYGWKRLVFHLGTKLWAIRLGKILVFSPQTLGPFRHWMSGWWADRVMSRAALVCTRDGLSSDFYRARGLKRPLLESTDVAFALPYTPRSRLPGRPQVGLNVSGLLWSGGYTGENQFGLRFDYRQLILDLVDWFQRQADADVWLVPHVVTADRAVEDDWRACQQVASARPGVQLAGPFPSPSAAKGFVSGLDFFAGARMHACIAAFSSGVPCVPMAYSRKFSGLFNSLGYGRVADCTGDTAEEVRQTVQLGYLEREAVRAEVIHGCNVAAARLETYRKALTELLKSGGKQGG